MMTETYAMINGDEILKELTAGAVTEEAKERLENLTLQTDLYLAGKQLNETTEARIILDGSGSVPLHKLSGMGEVLRRLEIGDVLQPAAFEQLLQFVNEGGRLNRFMQDWIAAAPTVAGYAMSIDPLDDFRIRLNDSISNGRVADASSPVLAKTRRRIETAEDKIRSKMQSYLTESRFSDMLADPLISKRDGRYVIPIKSEHKRKIDGTVMDRSRSGGTVFVEPAAVRKLQEELDKLRAEEEAEVYRILAVLSNEAAFHLSALKINFEAMVTCDFAFAKAKLSRKYRGMAAQINTSGVIRLNGAKHPLLGRDAVPLSLELTAEKRSLVITGPNTGGKTVTMKTVGLCVWMTQLGLHIPCEIGTTVPIFTDILCDIGDGQSIQQNLSTFSAHVMHLKAILEKANPRSLVLLDEIGAGTDPAEGMALGIAVLEALHEKRAYILASTHYSEIKAFAASHPGFITGGMAFDLKTLKPLYRLEVGKSGQSNALLIAYRLGLPENIVSRAHGLAYGERFSVESYASVFRENGEGVSEAPDDSEKTELQSHPKVVPSDAASKKYGVQSTAKFNVGDAVYIHTMRRTGIVCETENAKGEIGVMVKNKKIRVSHKRLSLHIEAAELYPEDYDMDIVFESKDDRKKKKKIGKGKRGITLEK